MLQSLVMKPMALEKLTERREKLRDIIAELTRLFPEPKMALNYSNIFEMLVAVILSAQCTDKKVNEVTEKLFKKYPTLEDYIHADILEFEQDIKQTGFYHAKAKNILATARLVQSKFHGEVPRTMEEILQLPGVARKTANVVLSNAYGVVEGIAVDTHVRRLVTRLGLSDYEDPKRIEQDLLQIVPKEEWKNFTHRLIAYGRQYCPAKRHNHDVCPLAKFE